MKIILYLCLPLVIYQSVYGQENLPEVYLNHIYLVLDSGTYARLFDSDLITQQLGESKTSSTTTTEGSWSGKYLYGKNGYFEFFTTNGFEGASIGDCGLGFMTFKSGDIWEIERNWRESSIDSIGTDTTIYTSEGKSKTWFYAVYLFDNDSTNALSAWVMENTPEELERVGFSREDITNEIHWQEYIEKETHAEFTKAFNRISAIQLSINQKESEYLRKSLLGFGLQEKDNVFFNNHIKISYTIDENPSMRVQSVEIELTEVFAETRNKISDNLEVHVAGNKAIWTFRNK